jgi:hypothetical protein
VEIAKTIEEGDKHEAKIKELRADFENGRRRDLTQCIKYAETSCGT